MMVCRLRRATGSTSWSRMIIVEIKAVDALTRVHEAQILTYLKLSGMRLGLLMNFNVGMFKQGLKRLVR